MADAEAAPSVSQAREANTTPHQSRQSSGDDITNEHKRIHSHDTTVEAEFRGETERCIRVLNRGTVDHRIAESGLFSPVISWNFSQNCAMVGLVVLSPRQHSVKRSQTTSVIPIPLASTGLEGRSPKDTASITSSSLLGKKGNFPVNT